VHGVAAWVVDAVDPEFLVELGTQRRVASIESLEQATRLLEKGSYLLGGEAVRGGAVLPELGFGGGAGGADLGDPLLHDVGVGAGLQGGSVAVQAALAVGQDLLSGPQRVVARLAAAGGGQRSAGVVEVVGLTSSASQLSRRSTMSASRRFTDLGCWKPEAAAYSAG